LSTPGAIAGLEYPFPERAAADKLLATFGPDSGQVITPQQELRIAFRPPAT